MTEQERFKLAYTKDDWWAVRDGEITLWKEEVIHLLNELHEENEELKKENERLKERVKQLQINNKVIKKIYKTFYKPRGIKYD